MIVVHASSKNTSPSWRRRLKAAWEKLNATQMIQNSWDEFLAEVNSIAKSQKSWHVKKQKEWAVAWFEETEWLYSNSVTGPEISFLKNKDSLEKWEAASIAWHKPMYEDGLYEWSISINNPDRLISERDYNHICKPLEDLSFSTEYILSIIRRAGSSSLKLAKQEMELKGLNTKVSDIYKFDRTYIAEFKKNEKSVLTNKYVFEKMLHAEFSRNGACQWENLISRTIPDRDETANSYWTKKMLEMNRFRLRYGHDTCPSSPWTSFAKAIKTTTTKEWQFYKDRADLKKNEKWTIAEVENIWQAVRWHQSTHKNDESGLSFIRDVIFWFLENHYKNITLNITVHSYDGYEYLKKCHPEVWASWIMKSETRDELLAQIEVEDVLSGIHKLDLIIDADVENSHKDLIILLINKFSLIDKIILHVLGDKRACNTRLLNDFVAIPGMSKIISEEVRKNKVAHFADLISRINEFKTEDERSSYPGFGGAAKILKVCKDEDWERLSLLNSATICNSVLKNKMSVL